MATKAIDIKASARTEFGKGAARRARRDGLIPLVVYSNDLEAPVHATVDRIEFTAIVRHHGVNAIVNLNVDGEEHLTMIKHVDQNPLTFDIDHIDLYAISRGEKVEVEVPITYAGDPAPGTLVYQDADTLLLEADVLSIPEEIEIDVEGLEVGTQILAKDVAMPGNCTLAADEELLVLTVVYPETENVEPGEAENEDPEDVPTVDEDESTTEEGSASEDEE
ncbi:General stress protein CTC [Corynebacterium ciconiae DSM 44920]|uniref:50S ribosomal protein L25/general stress protein Ctc n=1 Tax=Corynebacterium ciconiae TaxID=227319 RepID=UPI0003824A49|nr:50S ribosomal protein L25/general stress protein Ctc [Corynebacterium ciconiae]WKD61593.1 General stress protein CTC [Corynebacterium ciconiae DSM 44920]